MNVYSDPADSSATPLVTPLDAICVFCGSSGRVAEQHRKAASRFGQILAENGITLVFGGGRVGLMGLCADAAVAAGGKAVGIIPRILHEVEVAHQNLTELHIVETMHQRKKMMFDRSDAFVVLPGGVGTLDETFEIVTWRQLRLHDKPIIVVNEGGYWTPFIAMVDHIVASGFAGERTRQLFKVVESVEDVLPALAVTPAPRLAAHPEKL